MQRPTQSKKKSTPSNTRVTMPPALTSHIMTTPSVIVPNSLQTTFRSTLTRLPELKREILHMRETLESKHLKKAPASPPCVTRRRTTVSTIRSLEGATTHATDPQFRDVVVAGTTNRSSTMTIHTSTGNAGWQLPKCVPPPCKSVSYNLLQKPNTSPKLMHRPLRMNRHLVQRIATRLQQNTEQSQTFELSTRRTG